MKQLTTVGLWSSIWILAAASGLSAQALFQYPQSADLKAAELAVVPDVDLVLQAPPRLWAALPGEKSRSFLRSYLERRPTGVLWVGESADGDQLHVTLEQGNIFASLEGDGGHYSVGPKPYGRRGEHLLKTPTAAPDVDDFCGTHAPSSAAPPVGGTPAEPDLGAAELKMSPQIDTLVLYTPAALSAFGLSGVVGWAQTSMDLSNTAFRNSQMPARLRLVGVRRADFQENGSGISAINWLLQSPQPRNLRNEVGADVVALILRDAEDVCGVAATIPSGNIAAFNNSMFHVTQIPCINNHTFTHEMGHLFGMEHDPVNGRPVAFASFPWSYGHFVDGVFRTVMSYRTECTNENCPRRAYFSSPIIRSQGIPTGIDGARDNRRTGLSITPIIANFRQPVSGEPPDAPSGLGGEAEAFRVQLEWTDRSTNENGFEIERADDGDDGVFRQIATVPAGVTEFDDDTVEALTAYRYRVRAQNGFGVSGYSNTFAVTTASPDLSSCETDDSVVCLLDGRFEVRVSWRDFEGNEGTGRVLPGFSDQSAIFWFFTPDNWEMMVKMVDACSFNDHYWTFSAATTNVAFTVEVRDTATGRSKLYTNELGISAPAVTDTSAFATCPF
ncbi:MAG: zinc-dependent metalloprotease family protein [Acidobacteriota bacterium]